MNTGGVRTTNGVVAGPGIPFARPAKFNSNIKTTMYDPAENTRLTKEHRQNSYINSTNSGVNGPTSKVNTKPNVYVSQVKGQKVVQDQAIPIATTSQDSDDSVDKYVLQQEIQKLN
jgi:hypothetical protein